MNCAGESLEENISVEPVYTTQESINVQATLDMYEMYGPDKNHPEIPYLKNQVLGLLKAVNQPENYPGYQYLVEGNELFNQGKYELAIEKYMLNILPEIYTMVDHEWQSYIGIANSYLKLGDISSSINFFQRAFLFFQKIDKQIEQKISEFDLFHEICDVIRHRYESELSKISNSLDLYVFVGDLLDEKSGWAVALEIIEYILNN